MDISIILAKFWGILLIACCGGFLLNGKLYLKLLHEVREREVTFFSALISLIIGSFSVAIYNSWTFDYRGLITFLGWSALFKGFFGFFMPEAWIKMALNFSRNLAIIYPGILLSLIVGLYLLFIGLTS